MSIKKITWLLGIVVLASMSFAGLVYTSTQAQSPPMSDEQLARIRTNCLSTKNTLNQLHASDGLLRVNRGQLYLSISTKLMAPFNNRVDSNHFDAKDLISVTNNYTTALSTFRNDYINYEQELSLALRIDCSKEPVAFYDAVALSRSQRAQVHADIIQLHSYIDDYMNRFDAFNTNFANTHKGNQ
jgi:hypothetical protein